MKLLSYLFITSLIVLFIIACNETSVVEPEPPTFTKSFWNIFIMDTDGSNINTLTNNTEQTRLVDLSPLGSKIIFSTDGCYTMNIDGTDKRLVSNSYYIQLSPDETKVLYFDGPSSKICIMNSNGSNKKCLAHTPTITHSPEPKFSPDGSIVIYESNDSIYTVNVEGRDNKFLTLGLYPQYTPDGLNIVFSYSQGIYKMDKDGNNIVNVFEGLEYLFTPFIISPSGSKIAFVKSNDPRLVGSYDLCIVDIDGSNYNILTQFVSLYWFGSDIEFSPLGTSIIYSALKNGHNDIFIINIDGSNQQCLSNHISEDCITPIFTKAGDRIIFQKLTEVPN